MDWLDIFTLVVFLVCLGSSLVCALREEWEQASWFIGLAILNKLDLMLL